MRTRFLIALLSLVVLGSQADAGRRHYSSTCSGGSCSAPPSVSLPLSSCSTCQPVSVALAPVSYPQAPVPVLYPQAVPVVPVAPVVIAPFSLFPRTCHGGRCGQ
jgi:hypothetical protein